jgi:hypothetical protein
MDLLTAATTVLGPVVTKALIDVWNDWRTEKKAPRGASRDERGKIHQIDLSGAEKSVESQPEKTVTRENSI